MLHRTTHRPTHHDTHRPTNYPSILPPTTPPTTPPMFRGSSGRLTTGKLEQQDPRERPLHPVNARQAYYPTLDPTVLRTAPRFFHPSFHPSPHPSLHPFPGSTARLTGLVWSPVNDSMGKLERDVAPGEPAFIRRLPAGVEYTLIKIIFIDLPSGLPTLLWAASSESTPLLRTFNERTVRAIVRVVRREEKSETNREYAARIRHELVQLCLAELNSRWSPHPELSLSVRLVSPHLFAADHRPAGPSVQHVRITAASTGSAGPTVLDERFVASTPAAWDASIPFIDSEECDRIILDLVAKHFPRLLNVRVSARWRSKYSPEGWPLITQHIVPRLYDYLSPFYPVRRHRRAGRSGPGQYSAQLRRDITDIVRLELPHLAKKLTVARVTAAIQRYIAQRYPTDKQNRRKRPKQ